jgi:hypothetical protein
MDSISQLVENMDLPEGEPSGEPSSEPTPKSDPSPGSGSKDPGNGDPKSGEQPGDKGEPEGGSGSDEPSPDGAKEPDPDSGYVADEEDEGKPEPADTKRETPDAQTLTPELQYVVDRLPVLSVRGRDRTYQVKAAGQLPEDFEFASKHEELVFNQALAAQEFKAQQLLNEFNSNKQQETFKEYTARENADIQHDIGDLQREGELPRYQYKSTDKRFNDDPAVKAVAEIRAYMNEKNDAYAKANRPYRITFRDAYEQLAKQIAKDETKDAQAKEDSERKEVSRRTGAGRTANTNTPAPKARVARSMEDLMSRIDNYDFA